MAVSHRDRIGQAFELLAAGLKPYVDRRMRAASQLKERWFAELARRERGEVSLNDPAMQLKVLADHWDLAFREELGRSDRNVVFELRDVRNRWAHNANFSIDDTYRALDSIERLLVAVDATQAAEVGRSKDELMRLKYEADARKATPKGEALVTQPAAGLKPWRAVIEPHDDVARGRFALAEFAADLYLVHLEEGSAEYVDPVEFFRRTYLTEGLRRLLSQAVERVAGVGGDPVVDLQTSFGGGKTHSMIALYHLLAGTPLKEFPQEVQDLVAATGVAGLPAVRRVVLVGTKIAPGQPSQKPDGTEVRTLWGELAWQLGGQEGYELIAEADRTSTSPGDELRKLLAAYSPCLVLIDEWVAYARQLYAADDLPGGSFDTHFSFAQSLTEATRAVPGALLVLSLPASEPIDGGGVGSDREVGGVGGREALARLRTVVGRMEAAWRPASAEESFEIVRRRLFKPVDPTQLRDRDATARVFGDLYRRQTAEFPAECREAAYVDRIKAAYPIHPELFARLYEDWSTLERFQRTRGVLRLMAAVVHGLWAGGDQSPLILPASVPLDDAAVAAELTRNLEDRWKPIIDADIDGPGSLPAELDREVPNIGRYRAARRVARAVFLGSAATLRSPHQGIEASRVRLGCVLPGEAIATFGDALNRLSARATYLYADQGRYWYGVQPSVAQVARTRAERLLTEARDDIHAEIVRRLREDHDRGEFTGVHVVPATSSDVPDEQEARLVLLGPATPHVARSAESAALTAAGEILERRGNAAREFRNMLLFLAPDQRRLDELERGVAEFLAWRSVDEERGADGLNLDPNQARQAATKRTDADQAVTLRLSETYQWVLVPTQPEPTGRPEWDAVRVDGQGSLADRASRKLINEAYLYTTFAPALLRLQLERTLLSLWEPGHVSVNKVWDTFARYLYLPRLRDITVLLGTVSQGPASTTWQQDGFATAEGWDETAGRYLSLTVGEHVAGASGTTLIVTPTVAAQQLEAETAGLPAPAPGGAEPSGGITPIEPRTPTPGVEPGAETLQRFFGVISLDPTRLNRDFGQVAQEVIQHLTTLMGTDVEVTVEIRATNSDGFPDATVRTVSENARTLHFASHEFEEQ
jgi:predicted AAA+ superfamily ATPase